MNTTNMPGVPKFTPFSFRAVTMEPLTKELLSITDLLKLHNANYISFTQMIQAASTDQSPHGSLAVRCLFATTRAQDNTGWTT